VAAASIPFTGSPLGDRTIPLKYPVGNRTEEHRIIIASQILPNSVRHGLKFELQCIRIQVPEPGSFGRNIHPTCHGGGNRISLAGHEHARVTHLREGGVPDDVVLQWVGHCCIKTTNDYTHRSGDSLAAMAEKIGGLSQVPS
jgi:hypothetical protein